MTTYKIQKIAFGIPILFIYDLKNISIPSSFNNATSPSLNFLPPASTMIQTWLPSSCSRLSSPFNQLNMLVKSLDSSRWIYKTLVNTYKLFLSYMCSLNFKLLGVCVRTLCRDFVLISVWVFCVGIWFYLEALCGYCAKNLLLKICF